MILQLIFVLFILIQVVPSTVVFGNNGFANNAACTDCSDDLEGKWWIWVLLVVFILFTCIGSICFHRNKKSIKEKFRDCTKICCRFGSHSNNNTNQNYNQETHPHRSRQQRIPSADIFTTYHTVNGTVNMHNPIYQEFTTESHPTRKVPGSPALLIGREQPNYFEIDPNHRDIHRDHLSPCALTPRLVENIQPAYREDCDLIVSLPSEEYPPTYSSSSIPETSTLHR